MKSGCLCCSVRGDLAQTISELWAQRTQGRIEFEHIVIETTGMADPGPILQTLLVDPYLARTTKMDGIVTVADAVNGPATLDAQFEAVSQVAIADLIILSKTDLATSEDVVMFEERLRGLNPGIDIVHAVRGKEIGSQIYGLSALHPKAQKMDVLAWTHVPSTPKDPFANLSGFAASQETFQPLSAHDARIGSASIVIDAPIKDAVFDHWLDTLMKLRGKDVLRIKGIVFIEGFDEPFVFHGVQQIFDPPVQLSEWPHEDRASRIVVIARDLSQPELQRSLDMLRALEAPVEDIGFIKESVQ